MKKSIWPLIIQLIPLIWIPICLIYMNTPTNILNSSDSWQLVETAGLFGEQILFFTCLPFGIIGILKSRKKNDNIRFRKATKILSIINVCIAGIMIGMLVLLLIRVVFFGVSV